MTSHIGTSVIRRKIFSIGCAFERILDEHEQDCLNASTEMPKDYYSFMQDQDNSTKPVKPVVPMRDEKHWEL
ncbi:Protein canopy 3 [Desmophyllum pertusum]|uniref:Protein canopy 3 n=1 Tax=Desmophyllum pertusum TaxID=174260 RepID=A0A9W9ZZ53_9CNID|nr:Protein canopy 3 [Desmophyllum pertusum]